MSDIETRREARRRKILENSERRLHRISSVQQKNTSYELEGFKSLQNIEIENHTENHRIANGSLSNTINNDLLNNINFPELETIYQNPLFSSFTNTSISSSATQSYTRIYKVPIIIGIASVLNILLFLFQDYNLFSLNKIFIPLLCFEVIDLFYNQNNDTQQGIKNILVFIGIMPSNNISLLIKYFTIAAAITRDVMIYFFAFVCSLFICEALHKMLLF